MCVSVCLCGTEKRKLEELNKMVAERMKESHERGHKMENERLQQEIPKDKHTKTKEFLETNQNIQPSLSKFLFVVTVFFFVFFVFLKM